MVASAQGAKTAVSQKNFKINSNRASSKLTRTTAASANYTKNAMSTSFNQNRSTKNQSAVGTMIKPGSIQNNKEEHFKTAGDILNYPYSFDQRSGDDMTQLDNRLAK